MDRKLVVFDWDGTLIDSAGKIVACLGQAADAIGLPQRDAQTYRQIIGLGLPEAIAQLYPELQADVRTAYAQAYSQAYIEADQAPCALFGGVEEALGRLEAAGHHVAIATGKSRRGLDRVLERLNWQQRFAASRCADETASKPHPRMLLELMDELSVPQHAVVMVGDTEFDLAMAVNAGVRSVAVSYGAHAPAQLEKHQPLAIIDHLGQLFDCVEL